MRQYIKIQNISNINKYEINLIEFLNIDKRCGGF